MKEVLEFLKQNWYYVVLAVIAIATFVISCVSMKRKNKNLSLLESAKLAILENIPTWAVISEGFVSGADKKNNVLTLGIALVRKILGRDLSADENDYFVAFISEGLEKILTAPQKKLQPAKNQNKSPYRVN